MAFKTFGLITLSGAPQSLAAALNLTEAQNLPCAELFLQADPANSNVIYVGDSSLAAAASAAFELPKPVTTIPADPFAFGPFPLGIIKPSQVYVLGTAGEKLKVSGVPA